MKLGGRVFLILIILFEIITRIEGQDRDSTALRLWYDLIFMHTVNSDFRYIIHTNFKHLTDGDWRQAVLRTAFIYTMRDELFLQGGINTVIVNEGGIHIYEIRPWQGVNIFFPRIGQVYVNNFVRLEERFFVFEIEEDRSTSIRGRYALTTYIPVNHRQIIEKTLYIWPYAEAFIPLYDRGFNPDINRFRFSLDLGYRFDKHIRSEVSYMFKKSKAEDYNSFYENSSTVRITLRYLLNNGQKIRGL